MRERMKTNPLQRWVMSKWWLRIPVGFYVGTWVGAFAAGLTGSNALGFVVGITVVAGVGVTGSLSPRRWSEAARSGVRTSQARLSPVVREKRAAVSGEAVVAVQELLLTLASLLSERLDSGVRPTSKTARLTALKEAVQLVSATERDLAEAVPEAVGARAALIRIAAELRSEGREDQDAAVLGCVTKVVALAETFGAKEVAEPTEDSRT